MTGFLLAGMQQSMALSLSKEFTIINRTQSLQGDEVLA